MAELLFNHKNVLVVLLIIVTKSNAYLDNANKPCKYLDSLNITDGIKISGNDSITFEDINYPKHLYDTYDYEFVNESYRQPIAPHLRGCACKINPNKSCVRMCCQRGQYSNGRKCFANDSVWNATVSASNDEGIVTEDNIFDMFNYVVGKPCYHMNMMEPHRYKEDDTWVLFKVIDHAQMYHKQVVYLMS